MTALEIAQLIETIAALTPQVIALAAQAKVALSADDQVTVDAALAKLRSAAQADVVTAVADLNAAASQD